MTKSSSSFVRLPGTVILGSITPQGNVLVNSTYERKVPTIEQSVAQLGFAAAAEIACQYWRF